MWLNIDFNDTAVLSFDVKLYEVSVCVCVRACVRACVCVSVCA